MPGITSWINCPRTGWFRRLTRIKNPPIIGNMQVIQDIFRLWGTPTELGRDIGEKPDTVRKWWLKRIPPQHWPAVISAAARKDVTVTADDIMRLNPPRKRRDPESYRHRKARKIRGKKTVSRELTANT